MQDFILNDFSYEVYEFFPKNFFDKNNNEEFIKFIMKNVLPDGKWVKGNVFKGIYIIFPDIMASWWVWDLNTENKAKLTLLPPTSNLRDCPYPFIIARELYDKFKQLK